ncbi:T9SS type A sorting domain-containing protein [bacterium]|nr:T9SS type A sorting domain-containing protein [bacterium]
MRLCYSLFIIFLGLVLAGLGTIPLEATEFIEDFEDFDYLDISKTTAAWHTGGETPTFINIPDTSTDITYSYVGRRPLPQLDYWTISGNPVKVHYSGQWAYMATKGAGLQTHHVSDATGGGVGAYDCRDVSVSGVHAFVTTEAGANNFRAINVTDPASPSEVSSITIGSNCYGLAVQGNYAYVAAGSQVVVVNISSPASLSITGSVAATDARDLVTYGNYAYVVDRAVGLRVLDISNPASPSWGATIAGVSNGNAITLYGMYVFVAGDTYVYVVDISSPASPTLENSCPVRDKGYDLDVQNKYVIVADGRMGLAYYEISDPTKIHPVSKGPLDGSGISATGVSVSGNKVCIVDSANLQTLNGGGVFTGITSFINNDEGGNLIDIAVIGDYAYGVSDDIGLVIFDISDPDTIYAIDTIPMGAHVTVGIENLGNKIYIAAGEDGVYAYDISNPESPSLSWHRTGIGTIYDLDVWGDYVFLAIGGSSSGIRRISTANGSGDTYYPCPSISSLDIDGGKVYAVSDAAGILSLDSGLNLLDTLYMLHCWDVAVEAPFAYIAQYSLGFSIVNISDPENLTLESHVPRWSNAFGVGVSSGYAFLATTRGIYIMDVADPGAPDSLVAFGDVALPENVVLDGSDLFFADYGTGINKIQIFEDNLDSLQDVSTLHSTEITGGSVFHFVHWETWYSPEIHDYINDDSAPFDTIWYYLKYRAGGSALETFNIMHNEEDPPPFFGFTLFYYLGATNYDSLWWSADIHCHNQSPEEQTDTAWYVQKVKIDYRATIWLMRSWHIEIVVELTEGERNLGLGGDSTASWGYDDGLDIPYIPTGIGCEAYFLIEDPEHPGIAGLTDNLVGLFDKPQTIKIVTTGGPGRITWAPDALPDGDFYLGELNMHLESEYAFGEGDTVNLDYEPPASYIYYLHPLKPGWNMVSLKGFQKDNEATEYFSDMRGSAFIYNPSSRMYDMVDQIEPGKAYFINVPQSQAYSYRGIPVNKYSIDLETGWNMIGGLSGYPVPWSALITVPPDALMPGSMYYYDNPSESYISTYTLEPGTGNWVYVNSPCRLTVDSDLLIARDIPETPQPRYPEWQGIINIQQDETGTQLLFGFHSKASTGYDPYFDRIAPPPNPGREWQSYLINSGQIREYLNDIKPSNLPEWELLLNGSGEFLVSFDLGQFPEGYIPYIIAGDNVIDLLQTNSLILTQGIYRLWLEGGAPLPICFSMDQNFPNPFNSSTTIKFSIPEKSEVSMGIYNILGERVRTLLNDHLERGYYTLRWDGKNDHRENVATGIYYVKLNWQEEQKINKMILLK